MYEAKNHKELKKLLEEGKSPIIIRDKDTIKIVETMESLKSKGLWETIKYNIKGKFVEEFAEVATVRLIAESPVVVLGIISLVALVSLYALYKNKNIELIYEPDGTIKIKTSD